MSCPSSCATFKYHSHACILLGTSRPTRTPTSRHGGTTTSNHSPRAASWASADRRVHASTPAFPFSFAFVSDDLSVELDGPWYGSHPTATVDDLAIVLVFVCTHSSVRRVLRKLLHLLISEPGASIYAHADHVRYTRTISRHACTFKCGSAL